MASTLSPNMSLIIPGVGTEAGPDYAFDVNASLTLIDQHDHSSGRGVQITPDGLNLNATVDFQNNDLIRILTMTLASQDDPSDVNQSLSVSAGAGTGLADLWYTDGTGTQIQITKSGAVNVVASSIPGESYAGGTFFWDQTQSALPTTPANFDIGSITLRPNTPATANGITLTPPGAIASAYTLTLPNNPGLLAGTTFLTMTTGGIISGGIQTSLGITASNLAADSVTTSKILDANVTAAKLAPGVVAGFTWSSQTFTSNGTFNVPANCNQVFLVGAGGGGGGGGRGNLATGDGGGAGGSGAAPSMYTIPVTPGAALAVSIGAGGAGGAAGAPGSQGVDTSFGVSLYVFKGGNGGGAGFTDPGGFPLGGQPNALGSFSNGGGAGGNTTGVGSQSGTTGQNSSYAAGGTGGTGTGTGAGGGGGGAGFGNGGAGGASTTGGGNNGAAAPANSSGGGGGAGGPGNAPGGNVGGAGGSGGLIVFYLTGV